MEIDESAPADNSNEIILVPAGISKRFANYVTDIIIFWFLASFFIAFFYPGFIDSVANQQDICLSTHLLIRFFYGLYISFCEAVLKGKTVGKLLTETRAVYSNNGSFINTQTAFVRGLCRIIPFEELSAIGFPPYPWHDRWSGTIVIDEKKFKRRKAS